MKCPASFYFAGQSRLNNLQNTLSNATFLDFLNQCFFSYCDFQRSTEWPLQMPIAKLRFGFPTASRTIPSVDPRPLSRLRIRSTVSSLGNCACFSTAYLFKYLTDRIQFGYQRLKGRFRRIMNIIFNNDNRYEEVSLQNKTFLEIFRDNLISPMFSSKNGALSITVCFKVRWIMRNSLPRARVVVETLNLAVFNSSFCKVRQ